MIRMRRIILIVILFSSFFAIAQNRAPLIFQATNDYFSDVYGFYNGGDFLSTETQQRYTKDLNLIGSIFQDIYEGRVELARGELSELIRLGNQSFRFTNSNYLHLNDISFLKRTGADHANGRILDIFTKYIWEGVSNPRQLERLASFVLEYPNDVQLTELLVTAISNPDLFKKVSLDQNSKIKDFLRLMLLHPKQEIRAWAAMGLGYFTSDESVRELLIETNSLEKANLSFGKRDFENIRSKIDLFRSKTFLDNPNQSEKWLSVFLQTYERWLEHPFENRIQDYFDLDREYGVIKAAGLALLWRAFPNKSASRIVFRGRLSIPQLILSANNETANSRIQYLPNEKIEITPEHIWILADMEPARLASAFQSIKEGIAIKTEFGDRATLLSYIKYQLLKIKPSQSFLERLHQHISSLFAGQSPQKALSGIQQVEAPFELPVSLQTRLFAIRALAIMGEKERAASELQKINVAAAMSSSDAIEWRETFQWVYGDVQANRMLLSLLNRKSKVNSCRAYFK